MDWQLSLDERARHASLRRVMAALPRKASVVASDAVVPHVSSRPHTFFIEHLGTQDAEFLVVDRRDLGRGKTREFTRQALTGAYGALTVDGEFVIARRGANPSASSALMQSWKL
jgi:hypothetical protein